MNGQPDDDESTTEWNPTWITEEEHIGIVVDDHCFVVLIKGENGKWIPTNHIPFAAADMIRLLTPHGL